MKITFESLMARVSALRASERVTKQELSALSREALALMLESEDIRPINAVLGVAEDGKAILSPMNRKTAGLFFAHFCAFTKTEEGGLLQFGKKKAKIWDKKAAEIESWLADDSNDIWSWAEANIEMEKKAPEYAGKITKAIQKALNDKDGYAISQVDVLKAVLEGGVSVDALIGLVQAISEEQKAA